MEPIHNKKAQYTANRALIYLRVSTDKQAEKGFSIPAQREECLAFAKRLGYEVVDEYTDEGESARKASRPGLINLLLRCKGKRDIDAVLV